MARVLHLFLVVFGLALVASCGGSDPGGDSENATESSSQAATTVEEDTSADSPETSAAADAEDANQTEDDENTDEQNTESDTEDAADEDSDEAAETNGDDDRDVNPGSELAIDWSACWRAVDALDANGRTPSDGGRVAVLPNCATGQRSIGSAGDMSHPDSRPLFRSSGADGNASIEFTFKGDTLLQTNGGSPWTGDTVLDGQSTGVTLAWVGMTTNVDSHKGKYVVSGLSDASEYPVLRIEGEGANRFAGYGGGSGAARSSEGTVVDYEIHGVIMYLDPERSASIVEVDGGDVNASQDSRMKTNVTGLTLGNKFSRNFSTTDHQFVFLGMYEGQMSDGEKAAFWEYASGL